MATIDQDQDRFDVEVYREAKAGDRLAVRGFEMAELNFPEGTFVVVATGQEAKTFRVKNAALEQHADWTPQHLNDDGPSGKSASNLSPKETDEATFSKQIAERLYEMAFRGDFSSLILVADPGTLGEIRPLLHQEVTEKVLLEQAKTLINSPVADIERSLSLAIE